MKQPNSTSKTVKQLSEEFLQVVSQPHRDESKERSAQEVAQKLMTVACHEEGISPVPEVVSYKW